MIYTICDANGHYFLSAIIHIHNKFENEYLIANHAKNKRNDYIVPKG